MTIERYQTAARMSKVVVHENTIYLCGQVAEDRSANIMEQTRTMLEKVSDLLVSVGSSPEKCFQQPFILKTWTILKR